MPVLHTTRPSRTRHQRSSLVRATLGLTTLACTCALAMLVPAATAAAAIPTCHGHRATIVANSVVTHGTSGPDVIVGSAGADTIHGGGGNDLICAGEGADHVYGGRGNDRIYGQLDGIRAVDEDGFERDGDHLYGGPGNDHLDAGTDTRPVDIVGIPDEISWSGSAHGIRVDLARGVAHGDGVDTFTGGTYTITATAHGDTVTGSDQADRIDTGAGPDVVHGRGGDDTVTVDDLVRGPGNQSDHVWGGGGDDTIVSLHGRDHLDGGAGDDFVQTKGVSNDVVTGGTGDDAFSGDIGNSTGPQSFDGGPGNDGMEITTNAINHARHASTGTYNMRTGRVTFTRDRTISLTVRVESARLSTKGTSWTVTGTAGDDSLFMAQQAKGSYFKGLAGDDTFLGSHGNDTFDGGPGTDTADMWSGDDTCIDVEVIEDLSCDHVS